MRGELRKLLVPFTVLLLLRHHKIKMKITGLLLISLWSLCWAHPVSRYPGAHHSNSKEHWSISVEEDLNRRADSTDLSEEDAGHRLSSSTEGRRRDLGGNSCESCESNSFPREVSSSSLDSFSEDDHEWSTQDNEEGSYFGHQMIYRKRADNKDSHYHRKEINKESSDDESAGRTSLEDRSEGHLFGANKLSKEQFDVENDGMVYTPEQVLHTFVEKGGSDLTAEEDTSGDDSLDGNNDEDPGHTKSPSEVDARQPPATHGDQDGGHTRGRHSDDSTSSSSSSSESRNIEKEDNHIIDYGRRSGHDSYSSSQEDRYDFQSEEMQGDEPRTFESHDSDSHMLPEAIHSKESSQEIHSSSKAVEHFERKAYHYADGDSDEDNSPEYEQNKSLKEDDDDNSEADSQPVEDQSTEDQSTESLPSQSREDETSHSEKSVESSSRGQSRENLNSHSREDMHSQSREDDNHSRSREHDKHSQSREDDKHSWSREDDKNSQSTEDDNHSWSTEDATRGRSQSQSKENTNSHSREDKHSQSREEDIHSQSIELPRRSRENEDTVSEEDVKSDSIEDTRSSQEKLEQKSKETEEESNEHSPSKSQESHSVEKSGNMPPRAAESREFKWHHSRSSEKSSSMEESEESAEDTNESVEGDSRLSQSASSESSKVSEESASSDDSNSNEGQDHQSRSSETSESKEEDSNSIERPSRSREDTMSQSDSMEESSWSRSKELESRKLMLEFYHNKPFSDYDDNDCQDGY